MAPEVYLHKPYSYEVDFWSLGVIIFEMISGSQLFAGQNEEAVRRKIINQPIVLRRTGLKLSLPAENLLKGLLQRKVEERLG